MNINFPENPTEGATYTFNFKTWQYTAGAWSPVGTYQSITGATGPAIWGQTGTAIYYTSGNVGVGTSNPESKLHVDGDILLSGGINSTGSIPLVTSDLTAKGITAQALHRSPNAITSMFIYDTSKDSDGGAWTERCQHTSWWNETIYGRWLGPQANETVARQAFGTLGTELFPSNDFSSSTGLNLLSSATITDGVLTLAAVANSRVEATTAITLTAGEVYEVELVITATDGGTQNLVVQANNASVGFNQSLLELPVPTVGTHRVRSSLTGSYSGNNGFRIIKTSATGTTTIDRISIRRLSGGITLSGDYFQRTSDGKFYSLNSGSGITEVFRGNKRDFPRMAAIVGEASSLTIYDLTEPGRPMWIRFNSVPNSGYTGMLLHNTNCTGISAINGSLVTCGNAAWQSFLTVLNFIRETGRFYGSGSGTGNVHGLWRSNFANRNTAAQYDLVTLINENIANNVCNAVALTVLPDAPVDPVSNLRVPTIAVATSGGASVIRHNGSVANHTTSGWNNGANSVAASGNTFIFHSNYNNSGGVLFWNNNTFTGQSRGAARLGDNNGSNGQESRYIPTSVPRRNQSVARTTGGAYSSLWISLVREGNFAAHSVVSNMFNTGWMTGDIRRCFLSDVGAGSVTGPELVTNGTPSNTTGVTLTPGTTYAYDWELTATTARIAFDTGQINPAGRYRVVTTNEFNLGTEYIQFGSTVYGQDAGIIVLNSSYAGFYTVTAPWRYVTLSLVSNLPATWKTNVPSVRMAVEERSYKASYAAITGTLTKTQLASGTSLVGYSGWSAANYLQEPYSADLDFGTGEWTASAWVNYVIGSVGNHITYSNELDNAAWTKLSGTTVVPNVDGTADKIVPSTTLGAQGISQGGAPFGAGPVISCEVKADGYTKVAIGESQHTAAFASFDLSTGTKLFNPTNSRIEALANGWYRISCRIRDPLFPITTTGTFVIRVLDPAATAANNPATNQWSGNGTDGILVRNVMVSNQAGDPTTTPPNPFVATTASAFLPTVAIVDRSAASGPTFRLVINVYAQLVAIVFDGTTTRTVTTSAAYNTAQWLKARVNYTTDGTLALWVNGREVATTRGTPLLTLNSRYNLLTYTEQFDNAIWEKSNTTVVTNAAIAPNETTTAELLYPTTSGSNRRVIRYTTTILSSGATYTGTIYVKAAGKSWVAFGPVRANSLADEVFFNVSTGVRGTVGASALASSITDVGNGWYRLSVTMSESATDAFFLDICDADGSTSVTASGTDGVLIWGAQLETGSTATAYQRVTTVAETEVAPLTIGNSYALDSPFSGSIALLKLGATVPTAEQEAFMYDQEKQLFRADAACVLPDSGAIVDMAYDDATDRWVAVSANNESYWTGLVRNSVTAVPAGSFTRVAAGSGVELAARSTTNPGVDVTIPAYGLREELVKRAEAAARMSKELAIYDYVGGFTANTTTGSTAITSVANLTYPTSYIGARISGSGIPTNTTITSVSGTTIYLSAAATLSATGVSISFLDFRLPVGMEARTVFSAGVQQREGSTAAFTRLYDGFVETIRFAVAPGSTALITMQATRGTIQ